MGIVKNNISISNPILYIMFLHIRTIVFHTVVFNSPDEHCTELTTKSLITFVTVLDTIA